MSQSPVDIVDLNRGTAVGEAPEYCDTCAGSGAHVEAFVFAELPSGRSAGTPRTPRGSGGSAAGAP